jgi:Plant specific mitochondrial import receptor subunit TOM20
MALFASFTKKSKLDAAVKKTAKARDSDSSSADQLFKEVYQDYADVLTGDSLRAAALYHWGVALLHQAKMKSAPESINIYRNAIAKFSFCMTIEPSYLAAAIDAGVACMDLARARGVGIGDELYEMAKRQFEKANSIQAGTAAYNLACIYGLRGDNEACLAELKMAKDKGSLPDKADIFSDADMASVIKEKWFTGFFEAIEEEKRLEEERKQAEKAAAEAALKAEKEKKDNTYDPYRPKKVAPEDNKDKETKEKPSAKPESTETVSTEETAAVDTNGDGA